MFDKVYFDQIAFNVSTPTTTTQAVSRVDAATVIGNGTITDNGGEDVSAWGTCLAITANPTTADTVDAGSGSGGVGVFTTLIDSLTLGTLYHVRAYATNLAGTSYGADVQFRATYFKHIAALKYTLELHNSGGNLITILENAHDIAFSQMINSPHTLSFALPADDAKAGDIILANEIWLRDYTTKEVVKKFRLSQKRDSR